MKLARLTDYAFLTLTALSRQEKANAVQLAQATGLSETTVAKILKMLVHAELVNSTRGAQGGYRLARPAAEINLALVIEAMEGPIALTKCTHGEESSCSCAVGCMTKKGWHDVNDMIRTALANVSLLELGIPLL